MLALALYKRPRNGSQIKQATKSHRKGFGGHLSDHEGKKEGLNEGIQLGEKKGKEEGLKEGEKKGKIEVAKAMKIYLDL